jgi:benzoate/toluate 1,2-dioxygenase reductase subunit
VLEAVDLLSPTTIAFSLKLAEPMKFLPGQYVNIEVPGTGQSRAYSFSSAPGAGVARFLIRNIPNGLMSRFIAAAPPGTALDFTGPMGSFFLRDVTRPLLLLAGGTGLAPLLSMLAQLAAAPPPHPLHLIYGVTNDDDLVETAALADYATQIPGFTWQACVANPASAYPAKGYVTDYITPAHLHGGDVDVYLCGPPAMVEAVRQYFAGIGVRPASFHYEKFNPSLPAEQAA